MTFKELANIIYNNYPDLYDSPDEINREILLFLRQIRHDIGMLKEIDIPYLGKITLTEEGKKHQKEAAKTSVDKRIVIVNRWKKKNKKDQWKKRLIDIYFNLC